MELVNYRKQRISFYVILLTLASALTLSLISYFDLCSDACKAGHEWHLFGMPFAPFGIVFFSALAALHIATLKYPAMRQIVGMCLGAALGAEVVFILVQKYKIGHWCPVCLGISLSVAMGTLTYAVSYFLELKRSLTIGYKGDFMKSLWKGVSFLSVFLAGFLLAFVGIAKADALQDEKTHLKDSIVFGNTSSPIQIFLFTDWACPACRALESKLGALMPVMMEQARLSFIDLPVHPATPNFTPYNLAFMVNNKGKYLELRDALTQLSIDTSTPTLAQVEELASKHGVTYRPLSYSELETGIKYYDELARQFSVDGTPILVIINASIKKGKKLSGLEEITANNIHKAISTLK